MSRNAVLGTALVLLSCREPRDGRPATLGDTAASVATAPADSAASGIKACALVSADEMTQVTGIAFEKGVTTNDYAGDSQCRFDRPGSTESGVMVSLHAHGKLKPYQSVPGSSIVAGLGDSAVWHAGNAQIAVAHGDAVFSISFLKPPAKKQWAVHLARSALSRLQR